nr:MAG TPA: hypothetical protein [Caudoviricetes sp.]
MNFPFSVKNVNAFIVLPIFSYVKNLLFSLKLCTFVVLDVV